MKILADFKFSIHYADVDVTGFMYHAHYVTLCERARYEAFRKLGFDVAKFVEENGIAFVVKNIEISYNAPATLGDQITVKTGIHHVGKTSFTLRQDIYRNELCLSDALIKIVAINSKSRPVKLPEIMLKLVQDKNDKI